MIQNYAARITDKKTVAPGVFLLRLGLESPPDISFVAGQYVIVDVPSPKGPVKRLYSIASSSSGTKELELLIHLVPDGVGTNYLAGLGIGAPVSFSGPAGVFGLKKTTNHKILLATGTGLAPMRSLILSQKTPLPFRMSLFWGVRTIQDTYFIDDWASYSLSNPFFDFHICLSKEVALPPAEHLHRPFLFLGHIDRALDYYMGHFFTTERAPECEYYICGGRTVVDAQKLSLASLGVPKENVVFEKY